jgi:hypothetical protein
MVVAPHRRQGGYATAPCGNLAATDGRCGSYSHHQARPRLRLLVCFGASLANHQVACCRIDAQRYRVTLGGDDAVGRGPPGGEALAGTVLARSHMFRFRRNPPNHLA